MTPDDLLAMPAQDYMNAAQRAFFKEQLLALQEATRQHIDESRRAMAEQPQEADELDRALQEEANRQALRLAEREGYLLRKIAQALARIQDGSYGYCANTGVEIGLKRLLIRPTSQYCAEEKTRLENLERHYGDSR
jgi:DnaK suppressor protein